MGIAKIASFFLGRVYKWKWSMCGCVDVCMSSLQRWSIRLLVGFTDPYNHTYSESLWWKLFKNHQRTQIQRQRQWQRQRQRQRHRKSAWNTQLMLYFWNPDDSLIPNMMIDTSPWSSCSRRSPWSPWFLVPVIHSVLQGRVYHRFGIFRHELNSSFVKKQESCSWKWISSWVTAVGVGGSTNEHNAKTCLQPP